MANKTKIALSAEELKVVTDTHWILTKQAITAKIYDLFNEQVPFIRSQFIQLQDSCPGELVFTLPKISRGENYKGFPYVMLDYPSLFNKDQIFAVRTMLWWGNFVSITLLISGGYKEDYASVIRQRCLESPEDLHICVHGNPWEHHFDQTNYLAVQSLRPEVLTAIIEEKDFLKLAIKIDLELFNETGLLEAAYAKMAGLFVQDQLPIL